MNDDYLWDRSGDPDPEVERLERVLARYRYEPRPLLGALRWQLYERRTGLTRLAAAAAVILAVLAGLWILKVHNRPATNVTELAQESQPQQTSVPATQTAPEKKTVEALNVAAVPKAVRKIHHNSPERRAADSLPDNDSDSDFVAYREPIINPFIDVETARHIESSQLLLRSFRNTREPTRHVDPDILYDKQRSRRLLSKNILLRRDAEAKGNMPVEELLGSLEPFLLDIANLPDRPSDDDVRSIKERMKKKEIVAALQIYSAPTLSQIF